MHAADVEGESESPHGALQLRLGYVFWQNLEICEFVGKLRGRRGSNQQNDCEREKAELAVRAGAMTGHRKTDGNFQRK